MINLIIFVLLCWGLTHILVKGKIFDTPRNWLIIKSSFMEGVLTCHQCCSFWVGMAVYFFMSGMPDYFNWNLDFLLWGFISSGTTSLINALNYYLFSSRD